MVAAGMTSLEIAQAVARAITLGIIDVDGSTVTSWPSYLGQAELKDARPLLVRRISASRLPFCFIK